MMNSETFNALSPIEKLAISSAIASQTFLKSASEDLGIPIQSLTSDDLTKWLADQSPKP